MKYSWKDYWQPTPKLIRRIADSILVGAMSISTAAFFTDNEKAAFWVILVASVAKMMSNFFSVDDPQA
jgi:hypothetical protein